MFIEQKHTHLFILLGGEGHLRAGHTSYDKAERQPAPKALRKDYGALTCKATTAAMSCLLKLACGGLGLEVVRQACCPSGTSMEEDRATNTGSAWICRRFSSKSVWWMQARSSQKHNGRQRCEAWWPKKKMRRNTAMGKSTKAGSNLQLLDVACKRLILKP